MLSSNFFLNKEAGNGGVAATDDLSYIGNCKKRRWEVTLSIPEKTARNIVLCQS